MFALRSTILATLLAAALPLAAKTTWIVGQGAPIDAPAAAKTLGEFLGEEVEVISEGTTPLAAWVNAPSLAAQRAEILKADTLLVTPGPGEPDGHILLALKALKAQRPYTCAAPIFIATQKPAYKMNGLCDNKRLARNARLALESGFTLAPLPRVWKRVYTDDTFYNGAVPKGAHTEAYIQAAGILLAIRGEEAPFPALGGIHEENAKDLITSIRKGFKERDRVNFVADHQAYGSAYDLRLGNTFSAVLHDGAFEHALGDWLLRFAEADGRKLTLHYTTETALSTGLPCLFRTTDRLGDAPNASCYTRPAFKDNTGLSELDHLATILNTDAGKDNWMPFPLALAAWSRQFPALDAYNGALPSEPVAAMYAAMVYLQWTGATVLPKGTSPTAAASIGIGIETLLQMRTLRGDVNAILCTPAGTNRYLFSLWKRPAGKVKVHVGIENGEGLTKPKELTFTSKNFWTPQPVTIEGTGILLWKASPTQLHGQHTGARDLRASAEEPTK